MMNADADTWMGDLDLGEMFLNFWLDEQLRPYAGVDVTSLGRRELDENGDEVFVHRGLIRRIWERWERTCMGLKSSPYVCTQTFGWCEDTIRGNRREANNPLRWDEVVLTCLDFPAREEKLTPTHTILESNYIKHKTTNQPHSLVRNTNFSNTAD